MSDTPQPRRADAARNRARVLDAARRLFATGGVNVSLDDIARRAGVGPGTVHRHFPAKEALLAAILAEDIERYVARGLDLAAGPGAQDGLMVLLRELVEDAHRNRALKSTLAEMGVDAASTPPAASRAFTDALATLLAIAQEAGTVRRDVDADDVKALLAGAISAQGRASGPERRRRAGAMVLDALRADVDPGRPGSS